MPAYGIALNPSLSGAAMAVSSIAVVMNSLLLRASQSGLAKPVPRQQGGGDSKRTLQLEGSTRA